MRFDIHYRQTPRERYDTTMNADVRTVLETAKIPIVEEYGGSGLIISGDDLVAEAGWVVETTLAELNAVAPQIDIIVGRDVWVTEDEA